MEQTARMVATMESIKMDAPDKPTSHRALPVRTGKRDSEKDGRLCKQCKEMDFHDDEDCFTLDKNKDKHPNSLSKRSRSTIEIKPSPFRSSGHPKHPSQPIVASALTLSDSQEIGSGATCQL